MQKNQTPSNKETANDRHSHSLLDGEEESERSRLEALETADDLDELPFDLPRD